DNWLVARFQSSSPSVPFASEFGCWSGYVHVLLSAFPPVFGVLTAGLTRHSTCQLLPDNLALCSCPPIKRLTHVMTFRKSAKIEPLDNVTHLEARQAEANRHSVLRARAGEYKRMSARL